MAAVTLPGRSFDRDDPTSFRGPSAPDRRLVIGLTYAGQMVVWLLILTPKSRGMVESFGVEDRMLMGLGHLGGPVELFLQIADAVPSTWVAGGAVGVLSYGAFASCMMLTTLLRLRYRWHVLAAAAWGVTGLVSRLLGAALS